MKDMCNCVAHQYINSNVQSPVAENIKSIVRAPNSVDLVTGNDYMVGPLT